MGKSKISDFQPQRQNANKHSPRGMGMLDNAIAKNGWITAITTAADGEAIDGSARLETAYTRFGEEVEPIVVRSKGDRPIIHIREDIPTADDPRAKELSVAANRIAEINLDWDPEILSEWNEEINLSQFWTEDELKIELSGELDDSQISDEEDEQSTSDLIEEAESGKIESRVKLGEIWQLGRHKIACGDSTDEGNVRALLGDRFGNVGMVWSDPPYGMKLDASYKNSHTNSDRNIKKSKGYAPIAGDDKEFDASELLLILGKIKEQFWWGADYYRTTIDPGGSWLVWNKRAGLPEFEYASSSFELCWSKTPHLREILNVRWFGAFGMEQEGGSRVHPTQKPIALCEWVFEKYGKSSDLIFDPFLGSAPSIIAAQKMEGDRTVYGFELSPDYCEVICRRYEQFTGQNAKLVGHL